MEQGEVIGEGERGEEGGIRFDGGEQKVEEVLLAGSGVEVSAGRKLRNFTVRISGHISWGHYFGKSRLT